jgi:hypothetical protein
MISGTSSLKSAIVPLRAFPRGVFMASTFDHIVMFPSDYVSEEEFLLCRVHERDYAKIGREEQFYIRD